MKYRNTQHTTTHNFPNVQNRGEKQLNKFLKSRLWNRSKPIWYCDQKWNKILLHENFTVEQETQ